MSQQPGEGLERNGGGRNTANEKIRPNEGNEDAVLKIYCLPLELGRLKKR